MPIIKSTRNKVMMLSVSFFKIHIPWIFCEFLESHALIKRFAELAGLEYDQRRASPEGLVSNLANTGMGQASSTVMLQRAYPVDAGDGM